MASLSRGFLDATSLYQPSLVPTKDDKNLVPEHDPKKSPHHGEFEDEEVSFLYVQYCPILSCPVLSNAVQCCPVLSYPIQSCPVLSNPVLSCLNTCHPITHSFSSIFIYISSHPLSKHCGMIFFRLFLINHVSLLPFYLFY